MHTSRRKFLARTAAAAGFLASNTLAGSAFGKAWSPSLQPMPSSVPGQRRLVFIDLRGGMDGLSMLPPITGAAATQYQTLRPFVAPQTTPLALPGVSAFGLHPALASLLPDWNAGDMAIVQKVGLPVPQFSHFEARRLMALGRDMLGGPDRRGWIGRVADTHFTQPEEVVGVNVAENDILLADTVHPGIFSELGNFRTFSLNSNLETQARRAALANLLTQTTPTDARIRRAAGDVASRAYDFAELVVSSTDPISLTGVYGSVADEPLARSLPDIAKMIGASTLPTRLFYTRSEGFDTHAAQEQIGTANKPTFSDRLTSVANAVSAFITDLKSPSINRWNDTMICIFTEFGRRNAENQTLGTDHGYGTHMILLGGGVSGGLKGNAVTATDLDASAPHNNENLPVEIDYRTVFSKCLEDWLCLDASLVFDDFTPLPGEPTFSII